MKRYFLPYNILTIFIVLQSISLFLISCGDLSLNINREESFLLGPPEPVRDLKVTMSRWDTTANVNVSWKAANPGIPATEFSVEYFKDVDTSISILGIVTNSNSSIMSIIKNFRWRYSSKVVTADKERENYSLYIPGFNTKSATNIFRVRAKNDLGESQYVYYVLGTDSTTKSSEVQNLHFIDYEPTALTVTWEAPKYSGTDRLGRDIPITGYRVSWKKAGISAYDGHSDLPANSQSFKITNLRRDIQYDVFVKAKNSGYGNSNFSKGAVVSSWTPKLPGVVTGINYSSWNNDGFTVRWAVPLDLGKNNDGIINNINQIGYVVKVYKANDNSFITQNDDVRGTTTTFTGLEQDTKYYVTVAAKSAFGAGRAVKRGSTWTASAPGEVDDISVENYKTNGFTLRWSPPDDSGKTNDGSGNTDEIKSYRVIYRADTGDAFITNEVQGGTSHTLTGLMGGMLYQVQVVGVNSSGNGDMREAPLRVWTGSIPGNMGDVIVNKEDFDGNRSVFMNWDEVIPGKAGSVDDGSGNSSNAITHYFVEYKTNGGEYTPLLEVEDEPDEDNGMADNFTPSLTYMIRVTPSNQYGISAPRESSEITFNSATESAGIPILTVDQVISNSILLAWDTPSPGKTATGADAEITGYKFEYRRYNDSSWSELMTNKNIYGVKLSNSLDGTSTNVTVQGLSFSTTYLFRITAINNTELLGGASATVITSTEYFHSPPAPPPPPPVKKTIKPKDRSKILIQRYVYKYVLRFGRKLGLIRIRVKVFYR